MTTKAAKVKKVHKSVDLPAEVMVLMSGIEKDMGKGTIMLVGGTKSIGNARRLYTTGSISLDCAIGLGRKRPDGKWESGLPSNRIVEVKGPESSGKTTLCYHIIANAQKDGGLCAFIDMEHAFDREYAADLGVDLDRLLFSQPDCAEDALNIAEAFAKCGKFAVIVVDSIASLVPRAELEGQTGDSHVGLQARLMSQFLRKTSPVMDKSNGETLLVMTNQIRMKIGVMFGSPEASPGGEAMKFYAGVRMDIRGVEKVKDGSGNHIGKRTNVQVIKNKLAPPFMKASFDIIFGRGVDYEMDLVETAVLNDIVTKKGNFHSFDGQIIGNGTSSAANFLTVNKDVAEAIRTRILETRFGDDEDEVPLTTADKEGAIDVQAEKADK